VTILAEWDSGKTPDVFPPIGFSADAGHSGAILAFFSVEPKTPAIQIIWIFPSSAERNSLYFAQKPSTRHF
jgi:hypothetical protein